MRKLSDKPLKSFPGGSSVVLGKDMAHDSAIKHVTGRALYVDDLPEPPGLLHIACGLSGIASGHIKSMDLESVRSAEGVEDVITAEDIPGDNDVSPVYQGDKLLSCGRVDYVGQPVFAVAATSFVLAKRAVKLAEISYEETQATLTPQDAIENKQFVLPTRTFSRGDSAAAISRAENILEGEQMIRGQEHFYLEGQISMASPTEEGGVHVFSSSQHPSEVQKLVASVLGLRINQVNAEVRRMGGGFGGKESQAAAVACMAAVFAFRNSRPAKYRLSRQDDMVQTGKRHDFWNRYRVGFDKSGRIEGVSLELAALCGCTADLSEGIVDRAMFHADNGYFYPAVSIKGYRCKTNTVSNTAFRGFGGPKGMMAAETMLDDIARFVGRDPLDVRYENLYQAGRDMTPYGQTVEQHILMDMMKKLEKDSNYRKRRTEIEKFNHQNKFFRKGLALTPVKFGISFTAAHLNQAGALIHIYTDGSIHLNHGGTEMGQGLYTKIVQIVANVLCVSHERITVSAARTDKVPNTSPTATSAGTDLNGMAAKNAAEILRKRLLEFVQDAYGVEMDSIRLEDESFLFGKDRISFDEVIRGAYLARVNLSANGFYKTPDIGYDKEAGTGKPFFYFANGCAVSEVIVDTETGEYRVSRVDILHDVGNSLNPALDKGQIEGGFVQGMGWLTTEELLWDSGGRIISNSPANYKIPTAYDVPERFSVALYDKPNPVETVYRSKAVGEPPLMLAISVWCALRDAAASFSGYSKSPPLGSPATAEQMLRAIKWARDQEAAS
ncbi:MAG: xanthine dehydrogenase molybdopterin binding subunit [Gammaproteobacteria bacterium]|nr:xanthine dehydrogenase molybdopterin binding subunit [Gammaproteobacteria bacterium]